VTRYLSIVAAMFLCRPVWAQPAAGPEFEAAWVKPNPSIELSALIPANGKLLGKCVTLMRLISFAYDVPFARISGPPWLDSPAFDVQAKGKVGAKDAEIRLMTRTLLAQRFGLECHREIRRGRVYFLVLSGDRVRMVSADEPQPPNPKLPRSFHPMITGDVTIEEFAAVLSRYVAVPVVDRTGVSGKFHFYFWWGTNPETDPDIFQAVKEELGLKLESGKSDVEFLVIDRVSKTPTEN